MSNLLQSSQCVATTAPAYYTNYLSNIANKGIAAQSGQSFVGAQPLQQQAFCSVSTNSGLTQPSYAAAQNIACQAAGQNIVGAASPYLSAGTSSSPLSALNPYASAAMCNTGTSAANPAISKGLSLSGLCAANPYLQSATNNNPASMAQSYMSPYLNSAVQNMSDIAQRNIEQNITPAATAAAVGSGQFGSTRGAQVLGNMQNQAEQCLNTQIATMENNGYNTALCAAGKQNALIANAGNVAGSLANTQASNAITAGSNLGNLQNSANQITAGLGSTAANAQNAMNTTDLNAAQTAANAATSQSSALNNAANTKGALATGAGQMNLACINAMATLGAQCQAIKQGAQCYGLKSLSSLSGLLQGYTQPTSTQTTLNMSPLSALGAIGSGAMAIAPCAMKALGNSALTGLSNIFGSCKPSTQSQSVDPSLPNYVAPTGVSLCTGNNQGCTGYSQGT